MVGVQGPKPSEAQKILRCTVPKNAAKLLSYLINRLRIKRPGFLQIGMTGGGQILPPSVNSVWMV